MEVDKCRTLMCVCLNYVVVSRSQYWWFEDICSCGWKGVNGVRENLQGDYIGVISKGYES
jgi:hypothetical protein